MPPDRFLLWQLSSNRRPPRSVPSVPAHSRPGRRPSRQRPHEPLNEAPSRRMPDHPAHEHTNPAVAPARGHLRRHARRLREAALHATGLELAQLRRIEHDRLNGSITLHQAGERVRAIIREQHRRANPGH